MSARTSEPEPDELFALSREREARYHPAGVVGILAEYLVTDGDETVKCWEVNMLNALAHSWPEYVKTEEFDITFHSPTRWTCRHRTHGYTLKVWGKGRETQS